MEKRPLISSKKQVFSSMKKSDENKFAHQEMTNALSSVLPNSCFMQITNAMKEVNNSSQDDTPQGVNSESTSSPVPKESAASHLKNGKFG